MAETKSGPDEAMTERDDQMAAHEEDEEQGEAAAVDQDAEEDAVVEE